MLCVGDASFTSWYHLEHDLYDSLLFTSKTTAAIDAPLYFQLPVAKQC